MKKELKLIEDKKLRKELIGKVEVLDKVKNLILLPTAEVATQEQVAEYYEVEISTIERITERNADEIKSNGYSLYKQGEVIDILNQQEVGLNKNIEIKPSRGKTEVIINDYKVTVPSRGLKLFSKRAILNVGMLLRDSEVAKRVRKYLLDSEEKLNEDQKEEIIQQITNEQLLKLAVIEAPNDNERILALGKLNEYQNKERDKYKAKVENLTKSDATFGIREAKNNLGVGERKLTSYLIGEEYCYRQGLNGRLKPFGDYTDGGKVRYFTEVKGTRADGFAYTTTVMTIEGIEFFRGKIEEINNYQLHNK